MKYIYDYFDQYGLLRNGDTGDSARETGTYLIPHTSISYNLLFSLRDLSQCFNPLTCQWVRHPHPTEPWHADPKEFSRDQWTGVMCGLISKRNYPEAENMIRGTWKGQRFLRAQNGDLVTYEYSLYIRGLQKRFLYPLLFVLDLGILLNVVLRVAISYFSETNTADDINVTSMCIVARQVMPTPVVWLACQLYKLRKHGVYWAWQQYYARPEAPPMDEHLRYLIERYL